MMQFEANAKVSGLNEENVNVKSKPVNDVNKIALNV